MKHRGVADRVPLLTPPVLVIAELYPLKRVEVVHGTEQQGLTMYSQALGF